MKKNSLLKAIVIMFLAMVVLSWIIPTGSFSAATYTDNGIAPVGIINLFRLPVMTLQTFIQYTLVFLSIGIFYGVLNKTGVYDNILRGIAKKWKGKEKTLLVVVSIAFALIGSLTGLSTWAFLLVPFVGALLLLVGYDKMAALLSTVGALLVGEVASIFGFSGAGYAVNILNVSITAEVITKIILFILLTGLYVFYLVKTSKLSKTKKESNIPLLLEDNANKKSKKPLIVLGIIFLIVTLVGMYNWYYAFGVQMFNNLDTKLQGIKLVANLLNGSTALGYWGNYEFVVALFAATLLIAWLYNVKAKDLYEGLKYGIKEIATVAIYATLCNVVFSIMLSSSGNMFATVVNYMNTKQAFNIPGAAITTISGSLFFNDFYYLLYHASTLLTGFEAIYYPVVGVLVTGLFGIMMMVLPTSIVLVAGLKYFDIEYTAWLKAIWKYLLEALAILLLVVIIVMMII